MICKRDDKRIVLLNKQKKERRKLQEGASVKEKAR